MAVSAGVDVDRDEASAVPGEVTAKAVARNTIANLVASVIVAVLALGMTPFLLGRLGPEQYGIWTLALTLTYMNGYVAIADLGIQQSMVRLVAEASARRDIETVNRLVSTGFFGLLAVGALGCLALVGAVGALAEWLVDSDVRPVAQQAFSIVALQLLVDLVTAVSRSVLEGVQRFAALRVVEVGTRASWAILAVPIVLAGGDVVAIAWLSVAVAVLMCAVSIVLARRAIPGLHVSSRLVNWGAARRLVSESCSFFVLRLLSVVYSQMDRIIVGVLYGTVVVARYDVVYKLHAVAAMVLALAPSALMPAAAHLGARDDARRLRLLYLRGTRLTVVATCSVTLAAIVHAEPLLRVWVGEQYTGLAGAARLFLLYPLFVSAHAIGLTMVVGLGRHRVTTSLAAASVVLNLVVSIVLSPRIGMNGVIWGTLVGYALLWVPYLVVITRTLGVAMAQVAREALAPAVPGAAAQLAVGLALLPRVRDAPTVVVLAATALSALVGVGVFGLVGRRDDDREALQSLLARR